jgi:hypothetical protein
MSTSVTLRKMVFGQRKKLLFCRAQRGKRDSEWFSKAVLKSPIVWQPHNSLPETDQAGRRSKRTEGMLEEENKTKKSTGGRLTASRLTESSYYWNPFTSIQLLALRWKESRSTYRWSYCSVQITLLGVTLQLRNPTVHSAVQTGHIKTYLHEE